MLDLEQFESRKREHIREALNPENQATGLSSLERVHLVHEALPDLNLDEVRLNATSLGKEQRTPFYISGMTAGHADAYKINELLARACEQRGWAMGVGSQRRELEESSSAIDAWKKLRAQAPSVQLFANLGLAQIICAPMDRVRHLIENLGAQALAIHANALQECMQPEGTPDFKGALPALKNLCKTLQIPVILKETGCGFSQSTLARLDDIGLAAIDVSGLGGTHWGRIEGARASQTASHRLLAQASATFATWGESTVDSVLAAKSVIKKSEIWASGGVRSGLDAAKLFALGANRVGYAKPALEAALQGEKVLLNWMEQQEFELRVALFCTGCATPAELRHKEGVWKISAN